MQVTGMVAPESTIDEMLKEAPGSLNFGTFLSLFGDRLTGRLCFNAEATKLLAADWRRETQEQSEI